jgi:hypothetical protein
VRSDAASKRSRSPAAKKGGEIARTQFPREEPADVVRAVVLHAFGECLASV